MPRLLLTGFNAFRNYKINPTENLMKMVTASPELFPGFSVHTQVLETAYEVCESQFCAMVNRFRPEIILSFGLNYSANEINLERIAVNLDDADSFDNYGIQRKGQRIVPDGPAAYWATIPLDKISVALAESAIPVRFSNHAGAYLCNHLFYFGLHFLQANAIRARMGFIHVPPLPEQVDAGELPARGMSAETLLKAAQVIASVTAQDLPSLD